MTKKHYEAIAQIINSQPDVSITLAANLAEYFKRDNPNFDRNRFLVACGF